MDLIRKVVNARVATKFTFDKEGICFVVKNLTNNNIYACLGESYIESKSVVVLPYTSDNLIIDENNENSVRTITVFSENTGEVEVQCITISTMFSDMNDILDIIKTGVYGKDVRKAIHDGIKKIYNLEQNLEQRVSQLENRGG